MRIIKIIPVLLVLLSTSDAFARGDGTWPLRLRGEGTWPLRFNGESLSLQDPHSDAIATALTIRSLNETPLDDAQSAGFDCSQEGSKYTATGTLKVGNTTFRIRGICYFENTDSIEVVSDTTVRQGDRTIVTDSRMIGQVPESAAASDLFSGRLRVGDAAAEKGRYKFDVTKVESLRPRQVAGR